MSVISNTNMVSSASFADTASNPFLVDDDEGVSYLPRTKCCISICDEDAVQGEPACSFHMTSSTSPDSSNGLSVEVRCHASVSTGSPSQRNNARSDAPTSSPIRKSSKKILDSKFIARKSAAPGRQTRHPFYAAEARLDHSFPASVQSQLSNGHGHGHSKMPLQRPVDQEPFDSHARKRQRILSPRNDVSIFDPSASPLAPPTGIFTQNPHFPPPLPPTRLPTFTNEIRPIASGVAKVQEQSPRGLSSYGEYLKKPLDVPNGNTNGSTKGNTNGSINGNANVNTTRASRMNPNPMSVSGNVPVEVASNGQINLTHPPDSTASPRNSSRKIPLEAPQQSQKTTPTKPPQYAPRASVSKTTSPKTITCHNGRLSPSQQLRVEPIARPPPLERQRHRLADQDILVSLDAFVYGQQTSSQPPPGVEIGEPSEPRKQEHVFYAHIDPRTHRSRPHSVAWLQKKEAEIKARGGRKANFGKAAQRMKKQRLENNLEDFEASLPDRVRHNEDWVSALRWFQSGGEDNSAGTDAAASADLAAASAVPGDAASPVIAAPATPVRTKRPYHRRKPLVPPAARPTLQKRVSSSAHTQ